MPGDKFVLACRHYVGDAMLVLHPHGVDSGALASSIVWLACACQGCPINCVWRCAPVVWFAAPPNTLLQVIHRRPKAAPKAGHRAVVNNLAAVAAEPISGDTADGRRFAAASLRSAPPHPARVWSRKPATPTARSKSTYLKFWIGDVPFKNRQ